MPSSVTVGDTWAVTFATYQNNQSGLNRTHWLVNSFTGAGITDVELAAYFDMTFAPLYKTIMTNTAHWYGVKVVRKAPLPTAIPEVASSHAGGGTAGANAMPFAICGLLKFNTNTIGRKGRGRIYLPFPDVSDANANSEPSATYVIGVQLISVAMQGPLTVTGASGSVNITQVITGKSAAAPTYPVTIWTAETVWGTQHRRGDFGRLNVIPPISP